MGQPQRIALFGGTFDPIHCAHLTVGREARDRFALTRVLFIPASQPPHKNGTVTPYAHRLRMVELAVAGEPEFEASDLEACERKSYSILTIAKVKRTLAPEDHLYFLIGADAFAEIGTWYRSEEVVRSVEFIVVTRPGHDYATPPGARVERLETVALPVSSSEIRRQLAAGEAPPEIPAPVLEYIRELGLYR